jgi:hypothetical protein
MRYKDKDIAELKSKYGSLCATTCAYKGGKNTAPAMSVNFIILLYALQYLKQMSILKGSELVTRSRCSAKGGEVKLTRQEV